MILLQNQPVVLTVLKDGQRMGLARYSQSFKPDGSKVVELRLELKQQKQIVYVTTRSEYAKDGSPAHLYQAMSRAGTTYRRQITVDFDAEGAHMVTAEGANRKVKLVPLAANVSRANPSILWVCRDHPKPGTSSKSFVFDIEGAEWSLEEFTYVGVKDRIHRIESEHRGEKVMTSLDEQGLPLQLSIGAASLTRQK
jgi:hypothetical protein